MSTQLELRPAYWASVSGGKDSFYMLNLILHNLDKYPLDGVVHFELEIDYPFIHDVIDYMEAECKKHGIQFVRIKPRKTWEELYYRKKKNGEIFGFPTRLTRWCNGEYKLDAKRQLDEWMKSLGKYAVCYIGYCKDEVKRYEHRPQNGKMEIYPLVDFGINEDEIWEWAKNQSIYNNYYKTQKRCGCMYCPMSSHLSKAYLLKYYPQNYEYMMEKAKETEMIGVKVRGKRYTVFASNYDADYVDNIVRTKWLPILEAKEQESEQISLF